MTRGSTSIAPQQQGAAAYHNPQQHPSLLSMLNATASVTNPVPLGVKNPTSSLKYCSAFPLLPTPRAVKAQTCAGDQA